MKPLGTTVLLASLLTLTSSTAAPLPVAEPPKTFDLKAIDTYVAAKAKEKGLVGLSLVILREGKPVLVKGYGKASLQTGRAVAPETRFAVGSITKQFVAACILLLAEDGKLSVHDKVANFYPQLTRAKDISLYDLMTHASGYPDYAPLDFLDRKQQKPITADDLIRDFATGKLDFEPGTRWSYSNTGYILLGRIVEKVSGQPFGVFLERRILKPLGLEQTAFEPKKRGEDFAQGYTSFALGDPEAAAPEAEVWNWTAGGLCTTASDLAQWDLALMDGKLLKADSFRLMTTPRLLKTGKTKDYGCGLRIARLHGETVLSHSGGVSGFLTYHALFPRTRSAVVILTNTDYTDSSSLRDALLSLVARQGAGPDRDVPKVNGPAPREVAVRLFEQLQAGKIDRSKLG
jgi:CubicO group peptidase (beta-lactamase class C family)